MLNKKYLILFLVLFLSGCIKTSYTSLDEVPTKARPIYEVTHTYMDCAGNTFFELLRATAPLPSGEEQEEKLMQLASKATESCDTELNEVKQFLLEVGKNESVAEKQVEKLQKRTARKIVSISMKGIEQASRQE